MTKNKKTIQELIDIVLGSGFYVSKRKSKILDLDGDNDCSYYFCDAVGASIDKGLISQSEGNAILDAIHTYLSNSMNTMDLRDALKASGIPHKFKDRVAILSDWENRPTLTGL